MQIQQRNTNTLMAQLQVPIIFSKRSRQIFSLNFRISLNKGIKSDRELRPTLYGPSKKNVADSHEKV